MSSHKAMVFGEVLDELRIKGPHFRATVVLSFEEGDADSARQAVELLGGTVRRCLPEIGSISAVLPLGRIEALAAHKGIRSIDLVGKLSLA
jgi:hypothetical protein